MTDKVLRFLEDRPYWIIYYLFYLAAIAGISLTLSPRDPDRWATVITLATGASIGGTILVEVIGVLLIKPALQKVRRDAEKRVRQDVIKALEQEKLPLDQQRRILDSIDKAER